MCCNHHSPNNPLLGLQPHNENISGCSIKLSNIYRLCNDPDRIIDVYVSKGDKTQFQYFMALNYLSTYLEFQTLEENSFKVGTERKYANDLFFGEEMNVLLNIPVN